MEDVIIPSAVFLSITIVLGLFFWFRYRMRHDMQQTIRTAIDKGQELSPDIIDRLGQPQASKYKDLRGGLIWTALAIATALFGWFVPDSSGDAQQALFGIAAFPFCLGVAFLIMWAFTEHKS